MTIEGQEAFGELDGLLAKVNLSAPSSTKFGPVKNWIAERSGLDANQVACYWVSKPGNFDVRLRQPGVLKHSPVLAWALVPKVAERGPYERPAERLVANGTFEAVVLCERDGAKWQVDRVYTVPRPRFDPTLGGLVAASAFVEVEPPAARPEAVAAQTLESFEAETGIAPATAEEWLSRLRRKGQMILQGPPGTGKTWIAERLARLLVGDRGVTDTVQFHPAFAYEDFVAGLAPVVGPTGSLTYEARPGRFLEFCELARDAGNDPCVLVIDELNRADVSRVFGELLSLLEYRGKTIRLANGPEDGRFSIPPNVFIIGTMNTADRSTALLDHALRRRFSFVRLPPDYGILRRRLTASGIDPEPLVDLLVELNGCIADPDFDIGISYFMAAGAELPGQMPAIWDGEIIPYLREVMSPRPGSVDRWSWEAVRPRFAGWFGDGGTSPVGP